VIQVDLRLVRGELIADFFRSIESRFTAIEQRLGRLEQLVEERCGYQKDGICT
jgi:hypothetical protein